MLRFYVEGPLECGLRLVLPAGVLRHMHVLRLHPSAEVTLFNGQGGEYSAILLTLTREEAVCHVVTYQEPSRESPIWLGLAQALSSTDKMDFILQKGVEMGVCAFQPIAAQRSVVQLTAERAERRISHWQHIVESACEQCGRTMVPRVHPLLSMTAWLAQQTTTADAKLLLSPKAHKKLSSLAQAPKSLWLMAGPEGGFTEEEAHAAQAARWAALQLGPRILRTETAALAAVAAIQSLWGDL